jgi:hypothetical protein
VDELDPDGDVIYGKGSEVGGSDCVTYAWGEGEHLVGVG